jgi:hypothetical protein
MSTEPAGSTARLPTGGSSKISFRIIYVAGLLLLLTGVAKLISATGSAGILNWPDPLLGINYRYVFWTVGTLEVLVSLYVFLGEDIWTKAALVGSLATCFAIYRFGLLLIKYDRPCGCLGNLTDQLHIAPQVADIAMKVILGYLLLAGWSVLFLESIRFMRGRAFVAANT